jgi:hypothetical protein
MQFREPHAWPERLERLSTHSLGALHPSAIVLTMLRTTVIPSLLGSTGTRGAEVQMAGEGRRRGRQDTVEAVQDPISALAAEWWARAAQNRQLYGDEPRAHLISSMAAELEATLRQLHEMELTYAEAAQVLECSYGTIKNRVSSGELINIGTRAEPRVALAQLVSGARASACALEAYETRRRVATTGYPDEPESAAAARRRARGLFGGAA